MCQLLAHRGPDGEAYGRMERSVGHRRLAIIDLSGRPPADERRRTALSHYLQRRDLQLSGPSPGAGRPRPSFPYTLRHRGDACRLRRVRPGLSRSPARHVRVRDLGRAKRTLFMARDRVGKKPLFYRLDHDGLAFASEPKAFLADPGFEARPTHGLSALSDLRVRAESAVGIRRRSQAASRSLRVDKGRAPRGRALLEASYAESAASPRTKRPSCCSRSSARPSGCG